MCQAGKFVERFGRNELSFALQLHAADNRCQVYVAAAFTRSKKGALDLNCAGKNGGSGIGNSKAAIRVSVKSDFCVGVIPRESANDLRDFFRVRAAVGVANNQSTDLLANALLRQLVKVVQTALARISVAIGAVFAAAASGIHSVFKVYDHFKAVLMKALDGFIRHQQAFFRRSLQRPSYRSEEHTSEL